MRITGFVPSKLNSERLPRKNVIALGGLPLANYAVRILNQVPAINDVVIFASEPEICKYIQKDLKFKFLKRPHYLDTNTATAQDFISEFLKLDSADIIVLLHITSPFIKPETVSECIKKVASGEFDSAFVAFELKKFAWYVGKTLNYDLEKPIPRTQDIEPVIIEQTGLYVFKRSLFEKKKQRVSRDSYIKVIDRFEGHDIDTREDFDLAELILKTKLFSNG